MTIEEAAEQWGLSLKTIQGYIKKGYFSLNENEEIPISNKPCVPHWGHRGHRDSVRYKALLTAIDGHMFINCKLLDCTEKQLAGYLDELVSKNLIKEVDPEAEQISDKYIATFQNASSGKSEFKVSLGGFNININLDPQFGLLNIKL